MGRGGIDWIVQTLQANFPLEQFIHDLDQVLERAPQPIQFPDHEHITRAHVVQHLGQRGPVRLGAAAHRFGVNL